MSTQLDSWVAFWLRIHRASPGGDWIIQGNDCALVGTTSFFGVQKHANDNRRKIGE